MITILLSCCTLLQVYNDNLCAEYENSKLEIGLSIAAPHYPCAVQMLKVKYHPL